MGFTEKGLTNKAYVVKEVGDVPIFLQRIPGPSHCRHPCRVTPCARR